MSSGLLKAMGTGDVKWKDNEITKRISRKKRLHNLLTYVRHKITNAMAEGFKSKIQTFRTNARGFRSFESYRIEILF